MLGCLRRNEIPLWPRGVKPGLGENKNGVDIIVEERRVQVKHDWGSYSVDEGGKGNLFIQTEERNLLGRH